jgi:hypothetical protein
MTLFGLILLIIGVSGLMFLVEKAPTSIINADVKPILKWVGIVVIVIMILDFAGILALLTGYTVGK